MVPEDDDKTHIGYKPPPKLPGAQPKPTPPAEGSASDSTSSGMAPPPALKSPSHEPQATPREKQASPEPQVPSPGPAASPKPRATSHESSALPAAQEDDEATVFEVRPRSSFRLQRVQPPGHSEILILDRASYVAGRLPSCEIRLLTQSASREHANLTFVDGAWWVEAIGDRAVQINGTPIRSKTQLSHQAVLKLGGDELIFLDERAALAKLAPASTPATASKRPFPLVPVIVAVVGLLVAIAAWWFIHR